MADTSLSGLAYYLASKVLEEDADLYILGSFGSRYESSIVSSLKERFSERIETSGSAPNGDRNSAAPFAKISPWSGVDDELKLKNALEAIVSLHVAPPSPPTDSTSTVGITTASTSPPINYASPPSQSTPLPPPPGSRSIDQILSQARSRFKRLTPTEAMTSLIRSPESTYLVDIRPEKQREGEGSISGAIVIERNVLEWRLDPQSSTRIPEANNYDIAWIVFCSEGYASSLAVASLLDMGLRNATDVIGGFKAWEAEGRPVVHQVS
ncbi:Rhodanese-like domain-containing protein [Cantharellus anzutake]|uniref:Rhodanese-like domain-containing protein n=1 Tax=Cantharellus anzutake TaxID=1750568 RepID=UPI0019083F92|nr:Rhodanese-like domain-containing protein [Cantharellus anzutake]KAF8343105.1 Rhodanese-like domain-containing protein [Cantharellus anzutake]